MEFNLPFRPAISAFPGIQIHYPDPLDLPCLQAVYKGCTRDAHRMYQLKSYGLPMGIPCTPLVHGLEAG
ncbi:MAG: hypothetical protein QM840_11575 [Verrucomicrobiota bacterium]|nr:hypothetical protein [Verrucomicrobiota bacterium]